MTNKFKKGDKVKMVKYRNEDGTFKSLKTMEPIYKEYIEKEKQFTVSDIINSEYCVKVEELLGGITFHPEELEFATITNWEEQLC